MLKQLLEKFQVLGEQPDDSKNKIQMKGVALQIIGLLIYDATAVTDDDWAAITDQDMRKTILTISITVLAAENAGKLL